MPARDAAAEVASIARVVEATWRIEAAKIVATLTRYVGDFGLAEDLAQDALAAAMSEWPRSGVPAYPAAWLTTTAKRRAIDGWRRRENFEKRIPLLADEQRVIEGVEATELPWNPDVIEDDVLRLVFISCHPVLSREAQLALEALRLARVVTGLMPREPEAHGLVALMAFTASRFLARIDAEGRPVLLAGQQRTRWDRSLIGLGNRSLAKARESWARRSAESGRSESGSYTLQAEIAACHAAAPRFELTDWRRIAELYAQLCAVAPSPITELGRAIAVAEADGPAAGLALVEGLADTKQLSASHLLPSVRGELLARLGRNDEAAEELKSAAELATNERERTVLREKAARLEVATDRAAQRAE